MEGVTLKTFLEGGMAIGLAVALITILYLVVRHVLTSQNKILDMATVQNEGWVKAINDHTTQAKSFHESVTEAHKYQREEHVKCIDGVTSVCNNLLLMNESGKSFRELVITNLDIRKREQEKILIALEGVVNNLKDVSTTLGRINGYTHEGPQGEQGDSGFSGKQGERGKQGIHRRDR